MTYLLTYTGKHLDLLDPQPEMIDIIDIAKGLSRESRFAGQTRYFYSVAQHSVLVSQIVPHGLALAGLLHDASEAYLKDIPRPLKQLLPDYQVIEARLQEVIDYTFSVPNTSYLEVQLADRILLATERRDLMSIDSSDWSILEGICPLDRRINAVNANHAENLFMERFLEILQS